MFPFIAGRAVDGNEFLGREIELRNIFQLIRQGQSTHILGEPHIGKTSLLKQITSPSIQQLHLPISEDHYWFSYLDLLTFSLNDTPASFWRKALRPLQENPKNLGIAKKFEKVVNEDYSNDSLTDFFSYLGKNGGRLILLIDEIDVLLGHPNFKDPGFYGGLRSLASVSDGHSLVIITSGRLKVAQMNERGRIICQEAGLHPSFSPFFNILQDETLDLFSEEEVARLLNRGRPILSDEDILFARKVAGRHPYLLQSIGATLVRSVEQDRYSQAAQKFYDQISSHYEDVWDLLDDSSRTVAVILGLVELHGQALGEEYSFGEIENSEKFGSELRNLARRGLAERVGQGYHFDSDNFLLWREERWAVGAESFAWWIRDVVIGKYRKVPRYDEWLSKKRYNMILTQEQWDRLIHAVRSIPESVGSSIGQFAKALMKDLIKRG